MLWLEDSGSSAGLQLKEDGGQPSACGLIIEPGRHERHGLHDSQAVGETPPKQDVVTGRDQDTGTAKRIGGSD